MISFYVQSLLSWYLMMCVSEANLICGTFPDIQVTARSDSIKCGLETLMLFCQQSGLVVQDKVQHTECGSVAFLLFDFTGIS